jgi:hypothetical protein
MAKQSNGKKKARVWYSKGNPNGTRKAKGQAYTEDSVQPASVNAGGSNALLRRPRERTPSSRE